MDTSWQNKKFWGVILVVTEENATYHKGVYFFRGMAQVVGTRMLIMFECIKFTL